jgi:hypothetical protein
MRGGAAEQACCPMTVAADRGERCKSEQAFVRIGEMDGFSQSSSSS